VLALLWYLDTATRISRQQTLSSFAYFRQFSAFSASFGCFDQFYPDTVMLDQCQQNRSTFQRKRQKNVEIVAFCLLVAAYPALVASPIFSVFPHRMSTVEACWILPALANRRLFSGRLSAWLGRSETVLRDFGRFCGNVA
jgi:hypothetical protein